MKTQSGLTRRRLLSTALAIPGAAALPGGLTAAPALSFEARLGAALARNTPPVAGARLDLVGFQHDSGAGGHEMGADLRLVWPPGQRRRRIAARGPTPEAAFEGLLRILSATFGELG